MLWKLAIVAALVACAVALPIADFFAQFEHAIEAEFKSFPNPPSDAIGSILFLHFAFVCRRVLSVT
jgi:hypothetical protein